MLAFDLLCFVCLLFGLLVLVGFCGAVCCVAVCYLRVGLLVLIGGWICGLFGVSYFSLGFVVVIY